MKKHFLYLPGIIGKALFLFLIGGSFLSQAQGVKVSGKVTSAGDNTEQIGVSILVKGTNIGTTSNANGEYTINAPGNGVLVFSFVGFEKQEVSVENRSTINVVLKEDNLQLGEVVVTALGVSKEKRQLGFSVTEVKGAELAKTNEVNPVNALQGRVAGVQIDQGAGGLFGSSKIVIRGNSTLGSNNQPIFVVDGVIMDNNTFGGNGRDFGNDFKNLNPEDFESLSVLKGSAAAALYGSRAINGVILITTKKGTRKKGVGVSINQAVNIMDPYAGPDFQNEFGGGTVGAFFTDAREPNYKADENWTTKVFPTDPNTGLPYIDRQIGRELENWGPRMLGQEVINYDGKPTKYLPQPNNFMDAFNTGVGYNSNIAVEGGSDQSTVRLSYNHSRGKGVAQNNSFVKNAFDLRATHKLTSYLDIDASVSYSRFNGKNPPRLGGLDAFGSFNFGKLFSWMLPRNYDTKYWMQRANYVSALGGAPDPANPNETNKAPESRFWFALFENEYLQDEQLLRGRLAVNLTLSEWAKIVVEGNINNTYVKSENKELGQGVNFGGGSYGMGFEHRDSKFLKGLLLLNKDFSEDFSVSGYVGAELQRFSTTSEYASTTGGLSYPGSYFIGNSINAPSVSAGINRRKSFNSLYASADFAYKNTLFLQTTWRGDWSSALTYADGTGNNFFNYPAASLSWVFTESIKTLPSWVSFGKLRTNIAALGSDTDPFTLNPGFAMNGFSRANGGEVQTSTYSNSRVLQKNIKPSRKLSMEVGAEARFFKGRAGLDVSLYKDNTKNQILDISTPLESGIGALLINAGNIQNQGVEVTVDVTPIKGKDFTWTSSVNYSRNRNKIVDLYEGRTEYNLGANIGEVSTWAVVGKSYGTLRSTINSKPFQGEGNDPRNGLPILSWRDDAHAGFPARSNEWQDIGDINANFRGGWDNTFTYKGFSLNVLVDAKVGGDFVALSYRYGTHTGVFPNSLPGRDAEHGGITWTSKYDNKTYDDGIIPEGVFAEGQTVLSPDGTRNNVGGMTYREAYEKNLIEPTHLPQYMYRYGSSSTGVSDYWILKNSWVSLRQVALSYSVPKAIYEKIKLSGLSFSVVGRDLFYIYQSLPYNFNPASNNSNNTAFSGEEGFLPKTRNLTFSIRASF